jgi:hypothetical protein
MPVILRTNSIAWESDLNIHPSGVLATIGVQLIIAAHVGTRRTRPLPAA